MLKQILLFTFLLISVISVNAQRSASVSGAITSDNLPAAGVMVYADNTAYSTETDHKGNYKLYLPPGNHNIVVKHINHQTQYVKITLAVNEHKKHNTALSPLVTQLDEVAIEGKSAIQKVRETPFNVVAVDAKSLHNTTLDLGHVLNRAAGVRIRESGGVGSNMSVTLNGFTGRNVKLFMDGVPMQGFGSAFQLNNIPVGVADRIEIYKGVVPIEFGTDAMGGVINIVTNQSAKTFLDMSYSYGSFNTHRTNVNFGYTSKSGYTMLFNAFQNFSDNDYKVKAVVMDLQNGNYNRNDLHWVRRFNDQYHNETAIIKTGFVKKWWADRFLVGVTFGQEYAEIQNAYTMDIVYGKRHRRANTVLPSLTYEKRNFFIKGLNFNLTANYNRNFNQSIDTINRQYNWRGEYRVTNTQGEGSGNTLSDFYNDNYSSTANIGYRINDKHSIAVNDVITGFERKNETNISAEAGTTTDNMRRMNQKNVLGASYRYRHNQNWNFNLFGKNYYQKVIGPVSDGSTSNPVYTERTESFTTTGYGVAATYFIKDSQIKASLEKAYRLPTDNELFGDEVLETGNATLKAENSLNYNLGYTLNKTLKNGAVYFDINTFYRDTRDFIRQVVEQRYGTSGYTNHGKVRNIGADVEVRYYHKDKFMVGTTVTYQDIRNMERYVSATNRAESITYKNRMPNLPYFFGNAEASYFVHNLGKKGNVLSANYSLNYVGKFYLNFENLGNSATKNTLPDQISHDFNLLYAVANGKYNISFEARNLTNEFLYDNFSLQKPGRSFNLKFRYYFTDRN